MSLMDANALFYCIEADLEAYPVGDGLGGPGVKVNAVAAQRLRSAILKKYAGAVHPDADKRALEKFLSCNRRAETWSLAEDRSLVEDVILGEFRKELYDFWFRRTSDGENPLVWSPEELLVGSPTGPGASLLARGTDFYTKWYDGPLACTSQLLYILYRRHIAGDPRKVKAEEARILRYGGPRVVRYNRLAFVPKDNSISRVTCTEPGLNMAYQLGLHRVLTSRLKWWGIDLEKQQNRHRRFALLGSRSVPLATIDLSSASDSISMKMLKWALPSEMMALLSQLRSPSCQLPNEKSEELHIVGTMGNGFTFALETLLFCAVVRAVYTVMGLRKPNGRHKLIGVYGDDIVCHEKAGGVVCRILNLLGFTVNRDKSYLIGNFKESCGVDAYNGVDVRGVYLKEIDDVTPYVLFNRLLVWSAKTGIRLPKTYRWLLKQARWNPVPFWEQDTAGYKTPIGPRERDRNGSTIYRRWVPIPRTLTVYDEHVVTPRGFKPRCFNEEGFLLTFLDGRLRAGKVLLRAPSGMPVKYRLERSVAPFWGPSKVELARARLDHTRLIDAWYYNFML